MGLQLGQVVRYENILWRVDFVNDCRARIVPLGKKHVTILDDEGNEVKAFDVERKGVNISPNSVLDVVTDPERARDEIELEAAEAELRQAQREAAQAHTQAPTRPTPKQAPRLATGPQGARSGGVWEVGPVTTPPLREGSQAALVYAWVVGHPGQGTEALGAALPGVQNLPQCLSRLKLTGYLKKV